MRGGSFCCKKHQLSSTRRHRRCDGANVFQKCSRWRINGDQRCIHVAESAEQCPCRIKSSPTDERVEKASVCGEPCRKVKSARIFFFIVHPPSPGVLRSSHGFQRQKKRNEPPLLVEEDCPVALQLLSLLSARQNRPSGRMRRCGSSSGQ